MQEKIGSMRGAVERIEQMDLNESVRIAIEDCLDEDS